MKSQTEDETALIKKIAAGDRAALITLYNRTNRLAYGVALRVLGDPAAAEEVLLDIYTEVWKRAPSYDPDQGSTLTWLATIAGARCIDRIGMIPTEAELPDYLCDLLAARIERESQITPAKSAASKVGKAEAQPATSAAPAHAPILTAPPREPNRFPWLVAIGLGIAALLAFLAWRQADQATKQLNEQLASAQADNTNLRALIEVQRGRNRDLEQITSAISSRDTRVMHLQGQADAPTASVMVFWEVQKKRWLITGHLPPPPEGKVYQLWFLTPFQSLSACLIQTDPMGRILKSIDIAQDISRVSGAAITLEPEGGSRQPTPPIFAVGRVSP